jgi:hypothetical protein
MEVILDAERGEEEERVPAIDFLELGHIKQPIVILIELSDCSCKVPWE